MRMRGSEGHAAEWCLGEAAIKREDSNFARYTNRQNKRYAFLFLYMRESERTIEQSLLKAREKWCGV